MHSRLAVILVVAGLMAPAAAHAQASPPPPINPHGHVKPADAKATAIRYARGVVRSNGGTYATSPRCTFGYVHGRLSGALVNCRFRVHYPADCDDAGNCVPAEPEAWRVEVRATYPSPGYWRSSWSRLIFEPQHATGLIVG